ncbi:CHAT domain-containing protein [Neotamlana sedimentorum]|uniref:CHAT domain-containing protein n=1 Tax=Neotamlana sedimentorum TaxID=1435349 RepID=UPI00069C25C3|nr:CHAT domain-containing tetratricopeptide repeat protein [Tamlana sedimentorum]
MKIQLNFKFAFLSLVICYITTSKAQNKNELKFNLLDSLITAKQTKQANLLLKNIINNKDTDSLYHLPYYIGKLELLKHNDTVKASNKAAGIILYLKKQTTNNRTLYKSYVRLSDFYVDLIDDKNAIIAAKKALVIAEQLPDIKPREIGLINYIIGGCYYAIYDIEQASIYFKNASQLYEKSKSIGKDVLADAYNGVAVSMWTMRQLDSAEIYFNKAIKAVNKSKLESFKRDYYVNAFKFNLALVYDDSGQVSDAIKTKEFIIKNLQHIINECPDKSLILKSKQLQASAYANLAGMYNDIGFYSKSLYLLKYAFMQKQEVFDANNPRLASNLNQIALAEINLKEFDNSLNTLKKGLAMLRASTNPYLPLEADNLYLHAKAYAEKNDTINAFKYFKESESIYKKAYPKELSRDYITLLHDYAKFLAKHNKQAKAITIANQTYQYIQKQNNTNDLLLLNEIINLAEINYLVGDFSNALKWSNKGETILREQYKTANTAIDSLKLDFNNPSLLLLSSKAKYNLKQNKTKPFLDTLAITLKKAQAILEWRKKALYNQKDISELLNDYASIASFNKQIQLDLFQLTKHNTYLNKLLELHESSIYNRIRSRLNFKTNSVVANMPKSVLQREDILQKNMAKALNSNKDISNYYNSEKEWVQFLSSLKQDHPKYFNLKYATITKSLDNALKNIPKNTTILRYLFIDSDLYILILNNLGINIVKLNTTNLSANINQVSSSFNIESTSASLYNLYNELWLPIQDKVKTKNVIIIPDGELFNLSFETLTSKKITSFNELAVSSLLSKHTISYNYSLLLINPQEKIVDYKNDFIAFAPEFNDAMKTEYQLAINDSTTIDKTYLTLIPQPFSVDIAKQYSNLFDGECFINEKASKQIFTNKAKEHKIIHIGTHAESNNISPEFSRLIFAKKRESNDNSLYTFEIYNQNFNSNLAILTACETGKPTYQAGEGMISIAHAFNYAGSESILTSLWKIDEKTSSEILKSFYNNLKNGLPKHEALQQAKLNFLKNNQGRLLAPSYWSGLVLIGNTSPITFNTSYNSLIGITFLVILFLAISIFIFKKKLNNTST